jgi:hypothetical protein
MTWADDFQDATDQYVARLQDLAREHGPQRILNQTLVTGHAAGYMARVERSLLADGWTRASVGGEWVHPHYRGSALPSPGLLESDRKAA